MIGIQSGLKKVNVTSSHSAVPNYETRGLGFCGEFYAYGDSPAGGQVFSPIRHFADRNRDFGRSGARWLASTRGRPTASAGPDRAPDRRSRRLKPTTSETCPRRGLVSGRFAETSLHKKLKRRYLKLRRPSSWWLWSDLIASVAQSPSARRVCCSCSSSATLLSERRTSSANGACGRQERHDSAGMRPLIADHGWRSRIRRSTAWVVRQAGSGGGAAVGVTRLTHPILISPRRNLRRFEKGTQE